jgi:hypothetical protein
MREKYFILKTYKARPAGLKNRTIISQNIAIINACFRLCFFSLHNAKRIKIIINFSLLGFIRSAAHKVQLNLQTEAYVTLCCSKQAPSGLSIVAGFIFFFVDTL